MADKKVVVDVEIKDSNKAGPGLKQTEEQLGKVEQAAEKATEAVKNLNDASAESGPSGPKTADLERPAWVARQNMLLRQDVAKLSAAKTVDLEGPAWVARQAMLLREEAARINADAGGGGSGGGDGQSPLSADGGMGGRMVKPGSEKSEAMRVFVVNWPARGTGMSRLAEDMKESWDGRSEKQKDQENPVKKRFREIQIAALAAAGAASAAVAATAPATWATFAGSLQLVSGEFANMLIPAFVKASYYLQQGADWVRSWDDSTKSWVSTIAVWSTGIVIGAGVLSKLGSIIVPVARGLGGLAIAARASGVALASLAVNPWVLGIAGGVTVVAALAKGFGLLGESVSDVAARSREATGVMSALASGNRLTFADYQRAIDPQFRTRLENATPEQRGAMLSLDLQRTEARAGRVQATNPTLLSSQIEAALQEREASNPLASVRLNGLSEERSRRNAIRGILADAGLDEAEIDRRLSQGSFFNYSGASLGNDRIRDIARVTSGVAEQSELSLRRAAIQNIQAGQRLPSATDDLASARTFQPRSFTSGESFYGDILQQVLGRGELEQRMFQQQMQNDARLIQEIQGLRQDVRTVVNPPPR